MSPLFFFCTPQSLSCLEVPLVRCEDHAAPCQAHYLCVKCESCLQAESVPSTLSHIKDAILGLAVNTFIALLKHIMAIYLNAAAAFFCIGIYSGKNSLFFFFFLLLSIKSETGVQFAQGHTGQVVLKTESRLAQLVPSLDF